MKKAAAIVSLLFLMGCRSAYDHDGNFYVKSVNSGYKVCMGLNGYDFTCISKAFSDPRDADIIVKELNRDMEGNWEK